MDDGGVEERPNARRDRDSDEDTRVPEKVVSKYGLDDSVSEGDTEYDEECAPRSKEAKEGEEG